MKTKITINNALVLAVCLILLLVAGCSIPAEEISFAIEKCKNNGGLSYIRKDGPFQGVSAWCNDGAYFVDVTKGN